VGGDALGARRCVVKHGICLPGWIDATRCAAAGCQLTEEQQDALEAVVEGFGLGCNATLRVTPNGVQIL